MAHRHTYVMRAALSTALVAMMTLGGAHAAGKQGPTARASVPALARISVEVRGQRGSDVILIPGLSSTRHVFDAAAADLAKTHRVHLVQVKGFGEPAGANTEGPVLAPVVADIAAYARSLRRQVTVVGHSMGGLSAMMTGLAAPEAVRDVVVIDALPFFGIAFGSDSVDALKPRAIAMADAMRKQAAGNTPDFNAPDCSKAQGPVASPQGNMTNSQAGQCHITHGLRASDGNVVAGALYDVMTTDVRPQLAAMKPRLTVLYAEDDRLLSKEAADALYRKAYAAADQARLVRVEGSYHFIMQDQPQRFLAELHKVVGDK